MRTLPSTQHRTIRGLHLSISKTSSYCFYISPFFLCPYSQYRFSAIQQVLLRLQRYKKKQNNTRPQKPFFTKTNFFAHSPTLPPQHFPPHRYSPHNTARMPRIHLSINPSHPHHQPAIPQPSPHHYPIITPSLSHHHLTIIPSLPHHYPIITPPSSHNKPTINPLQTLIKLRTKLR